MKVLVLGSHGCVGTAVARHFQSQGHTVIPWDIKMGEQYDLRKPNNLDSILSSVDFVVFLAFDVGGSKYNSNSIENIQNNLDLLRNTFESLSKHKKPFIHTSSQMSNMNNNPYAVMKRLGEMYTYILGGVNVKLWNVYGSEPITEKSHVIPDFIHQAIHDSKIQMRTKGEEQRMFLYCDDFAEAVYTIFNNYEKFKGQGDIDISCDSWLSIKDIAYVIKNLTMEILKKDIPVLEGTGIDTFQNRRNEPQNSLLNSLWTPRVTIEDGVRKVYESFITPKE